MVELNPELNFYNFRIGPSIGDELAYKAALKFAEDPINWPYDTPLFIYGGTDSSRTHLLQAIANLASEKDLQVLFVSCQEFMDDVNRLKYLSNTLLLSSTLRQFYQRYRTPDILLIEGIQLIAPHWPAQVEFYHTFNALLNTRRQIVLSSDRPPNSIPLKTLKKDLHSRFMGGLTIQITT